MILASALLHFGSICLLIILTCLGTGFGAGYASMHAIRALNIAPAIKSDIFRILIVGLAVLETGGIIGVIMAIMLFNQPTTVDNFYFIGLGEIGIALAVGLSGFFVGLVSSLPVKAAVTSLARQPFYGNNLTNMMLITQSIIQTPVIFGFITALVIKMQLPTVTSLKGGLTMIAAGLAMGGGSIGPTIGLARFAQKAIEGIGMNRDAYGKLLTYAFISQAIIETPIIFSLLVSLIILFSSVKAGSTYDILATFAAALAIALSTASPGLGSSRVASTGCKQIALHPENAMAINRVSVIAQGLIDAAAIYGLLIATLILFFK